MGAVALIAGHEVRARARRALALAVVVGVLGALVLTIAAGARRTGSALDRFRSTTRSADIELAVAGDPTPAQLGSLSRSRAVVAIAQLRAFGLVVPHVRNLVAIGAPVGPAFGTAVDRGRIVSGRAVDPRAPLELAIGESLASQLHARVGGVLTVSSYSPSQIAAVLGGVQDVGRLAGPKIGLHIVGIVRRPLDLSDRAESGGFLVLSPAFSRAYGGRVGVFGSYLRIRTRDGATGAAAAIAAARKVFGPSLFDTEGLASETNGVRDAVHVVVVTLWVLDAVVAVAALVVLVLVFLRELALVGARYAATNALGLTRRQRSAAGAPFAAIAIGVGAILAGSGAIALSPLFPVGVARRAEPRLGVRVDGAVIGVGILGLVALLGAIAGLAAWRGTRPARPRAARARGLATGIDRLARSGCAPTVTYGLRLAADSERDRRAAAVRSAVAGVVLGVVGITGASVFAASLDHLVSTPHLYGATYDFEVADATANTRCGGNAFGLSRERGIAALTEVCAQNIAINGRATPAIALTDLRGDPVDPEVVDGRAPRGPHELALGAQTLRALHVHLGDHVTVGRQAVTGRFQIVGRIVLPAVGRAQPLADGASFTGEGFAPFFDRNVFTRAFVGRFAPGADRAAVETRLAAVRQIGRLTRPGLAVEVARVRQIDWFPVALGALFGGLALLAVAHAVVTGVRRRRRDLAVLKTLGFVRRQVRAAVAWQAVALAAVGLSIGVPLGILAGRLAWRVVASDLGVASSVTVPALVLVLTVPATVAAVSLVALVPARMAARTQLGAALRSE